MSLKDMLKSALKNLLHHKMRSFLTAIAIFIGTFTIYLTLGVNLGINAYLDQQIENVGGENQLTVTRQRATSFKINDSTPIEYSDDTAENTESMELNNQDVTNISELASLTEVDPIKVLRLQYAQGVNDKKYLLPVNQGIFGIQYDLRAGSLINLNSEDYQINIPDEFISALGFSTTEEALGSKIELAVQNQVTLETELLEVEIVGILNKSLIQGGQSIVNRALANEIIAISQQDLPDNVGDNYQFISVEVKRDQGNDSIAAVKKELNDLGYEGITVEDSIGIMHNVINGITAVLILFGVLTLLAACFGIINTLYMSVQDRTREVGLMKALGLDKGRIFLIFSFEAILLGFLGAILGISSAYGAGSVINNLATTGFLSELTGLELVKLDLLTSLYLLLIVLAISFLAGTFPAKKAAKLDPITALRYE